MTLMGFVHIFTCSSNFYKNSFFGFKGRICMSTHTCTHTHTSSCLNTPHWIDIGKCSLPLFTFCFYISPSHYPFIVKSNYMMTYILIVILSGRTDRKSCKAYTANADRISFIFQAHDMLSIYIS